MKFSLRKPTSYEDHEWLVELHNDPLVLMNVTNPSPITLESHLLWWSSIKNSSSEVRLLFEVDGTRAGFTKFYSIDRSNKSCVLGADLHSSFRGRRLAEPMWKLMLDKCFNEFLLHRVSLTTAEYNEIGRHLYQKLGFKEEGRLVQSLYRNGKYYDQVCMRLLTAEFKSNT